MNARALGMVLALAGFPTTAQATAQPPHQPFKVMTYNVRQVNAADTGAYTWTNRSPKVMQTIADINADIWGVQESSAAAIKEDLIEAFDDEYARFQPNNGSPKTIFFRRSRFERLPGATADVEGVLSIPNPYGEGAACHENGAGRTAAWVKLRDKQSGRGYLVVNLHTAHGANCFLARNRAATALHELIAAQRGDLTVIVFGDLNTDPQRASGFNDDDQLIPTIESTQPGYMLRRSARYSGDTTEATQTFNSAWKGPSTSHTRLDYIFTSIEDATTYRPSVDQREIGGISPSDHYPVAAWIVPAPFTPSVRSDAQGDGALAGVQLAFADVDGDGDDDKIVWRVGGNGGRPLVALSAGDGTFTPGAADATGTASGETNLFGDLDGDGCVDRVLWGAVVDGGRLRVHRARCDGTFDATPLRLAGSTSASTRFRFAFLDDDRCADVMAWDPSAAEGRPRVALSTCSGITAYADTADGGRGQNGDASIELADVDGDGRADKIVWDRLQHGGRTQVYRGVGDGTFVHLQDHSGGSSGVAASRFLYGDIDGDGFADKIFWRFNFRQGRPQLYRGGANGFDAHPVMVNAGTSTRETTRYFLADVDGNGAVDWISHDVGVAGGASRVYLALQGAPGEGEGEGEGEAGEGEGEAGEGEGDAGEGEAGEGEAGEGEGEAPGEPEAPEAGAVDDAVPPSVVQGCGQASPGSAAFLGLVLWLWGRWRRPLSLPAP